MKMRLFIILVTFLSGCFAFGGQENYVNRLEGNSLTVNATYSTYDSHYWDMFVNSNWPTLFTNQKVSNYVRLGVRPDFVQPNSVYSFSVQVQIDYQTWGTSGIYTAGTTTQTLAVSYDPNGNNLITDLSTYSFSNAHFVKVKILSITGTSSFTRENVYLETGIDVERYYPFNNQTAVTSTISASAPNLNITWSPVPGAEFYEIEYVHVNKYTFTSLSYLTPGQLKYDFYRNSTRVDVTNTYYTLPNIFNRGYFLYRIRAVGKKGTNFSERDNGIWNVAESGTVSSLIASNPTNQIDVGPEYNIQMNWSHQVAFTEGGKRMEGVSFSDGLGRGRQQVGLNPENGQVIVSNVYYDELGRPAVSDMPTPVSNDYLRHFANFNRADVVGTPSYQFQYFDLVQGSCPSISRGFANTSGAGKYYSTANSSQDGANGMIPNAESFPFSRTTYLNDFTGRVNKVSAAGPNLKMGSGKEAQYVYAAPEQWELNLLFGIEVGDYSHYEKMITVDPNGQTYVQYMDMAGRVIASYIEGDSPTNVTPVEDNTIVQTVIPLLEAGGNQDVDPSVPSAEVFIPKYISSPGDYTFTYGFTPAEYHSICLPSEICFDCVYDLELRILDECSEVVYENTVTVNGETFDAICNGEEFPDLSVELFLTKQTYRISKKLSVNQASIDEYWCLYLENNTCISPLSSIFNNYYTNEPFSNCDPVVIDLDEEEAGPCDGYREAMLSDLRPGGQYAKYIVTGGTSYSSTDPWSILTPYGTNAYPATIDWQHPPSPYLDENNVDVTAAVTSQGLGYFINNFRPEWAELFLNQHPEHCHLDFCLANGASQEYDAAMMGIIEFDEAISGGYFEPLGETNITAICTAVKNQFTASTANSDPFFTSLPGSGYLTQMNGDVTSYITLDGTAWGGSNVTLNLWQYAIYVANNCAPTVNPLICTRDSCDACSYDKIWLTFRDLYLELKNKYVLLAQEAYAHANCPGSACIGVNPTTCTGNDALLAGKVPNFVNTLIYAPILGAGNPADVYAAMVEDNCQISCEEFADQWIADLSGCNFASYDTLGLHQDLIDLCMEGCTVTHPMGSSTAPAGSTYVTINQVLAHYLGSGFETSLCTDLLISEPGPYEELLPGSETAVSAPLDTCGCNYYFDHSRDYQQAILNSTVPTDVDNLEEWIAHFTGVFLEDVDEILCECSKYQTEGVWHTDANEDLIASGLNISADISCDKGVNCIDCTQMTAGINLLVIRFTDVTTPDQLAQSQTYQTVLTNYFNRTYDFNLMAYDYMDFISRCNATPDNPYCVDNPLLSEWILQTSLLAMRGQLTTSISNLDLNVQNIVYEKGQLRNHGQGNILNSSLSGSTLTMTYTGTGYTSCNYQLTLPVGATFGFNDIVSFEDFEVPETGCGEHSDFTCTVSYYDCGVRKYAELEGTSSCLVAETCYCSSSGQTLCYDPFAIPYSPCFQPELNQLMASAISDYEHTIQETYVQFVESYKTTCAAAFVTEHISISGGFTQYQYTLFYYDQAGNLARTVAPQGVHKLPAANSGLVNTARDAVTGSSPGSYPSATTSIKPVHDYITTYNYNSYNQLVKTTNPDQRDAANPTLLGATNFWYDRYGRLVASQNPAQAAVNKYSYVFFDPQGRPVQVGQTVKLAAPNETTELKVNDYGTAFQAWANGGTRTEVTVTQYDKALSAAVQTKFATGTQDNLRLRVASILYFQSVSGATNWQTDYETAVHYSYDIHGNVKEQIQDVPMLAVVGQTNKSTQYEYELVSGNVNKVVYQKDKADQITHSYKYDKLNRLREASTSTDKVHSDRHAKYYFYDYGPMARVELGQNKVQSMDYVYTINGWIKGMNSSTLNNTRDVGKDGGFGYFSANNQEHLESAIDVSGYTIGYFGNDYKSIAAGTGFEADYSTGSFGSGSPNLYNGNIRNLVTSVVGMTTMGSTYKYDQLNRLLSMDAYFNTSGLAASNNWTSGVLSTDYKSTYSYDRNGNLKTLLRNGSTTLQLAMDNLTYNMTAPGAIPWNRLNYVTDAVGATANYEDIDGQSAGNYGYDALGQLTSDAAEGIQTITWRSGDKKVQKIERSTAKPNAPQMEFIYNPFGQRVLKIEKPRISNVIQPSNTWKYSYYSYDANGQVLAVYDLILGTTTVKADLNELHLYGGSRLGMIEHPVPLWNTIIIPYIPQSLTTHKSGEVRYEITNYLGNVNAVVNDRKIPRATLVRATFSVSNESWSSLNATLNPGSTMMQVAPTTTGSNANKAFTTTTGSRYILRLRTDKGSSSDLKVVIGGGSPITLVNAQQNSILFTAASGSTTVTVSQVTGSTAAYYIDHFELVEDHIYDATLKMSSDYYPFGMQMPGRSTNSGTYRYGYTGKENDLETKGNGNSYDFGNRQYDPRLGRWLSLDPLKAMYPSMTPYCYAGNTPIVAKDPDGNRIIIVNGYYNNRKVGPVNVGAIVGKTSGGKSYWGEGFEDEAQMFLGDYSGNTKFVDGNTIGATADGEEIFQAGYDYAKSNFKSLTEGMDKDEVINLVGHSMGAAYAAGMAKYFEEEGTYKVDQMVLLSAYDARSYSVPKSAMTYQLGYDGDPVSNVWKQAGNIDVKGIVNREDLATWHKHGTTTNAGVFTELYDLKSAKLTKTNGSHDTYMPDKASNEVDGKMYSRQSLYKISNTFYQTDFKYIKTLNGQRFHRHDEGIMYRPGEKGEIIIKKEHLFNSENEDRP